MRIRHQTACAVLVCSLGGLGIAIALGSGYRHLEIKTRDLGENSVVLRDIAQLKTAISQWFITIDLFFNEGQTYLAEGIGEQADGLREALGNITESKLAHNSRDHIRACDNLIAQIGQTITDAASLEEEQRHKQLNQVIADTDMASGNIITHLDQIDQGIQATSSQINQALATQRYWLSWLGIGSVLGYLLLVVVIWRWLTINLVQPITRLTMATAQAVDSIDSFHIPESGPQEIRKLTRDIGSFILNLNTARWRAEEEKLYSAETAARIGAIMDAAADAILTLDENGFIETLNNAAQNLLGYTREEAVEKHISQFIKKHFGSQPQINASSVVCVSQTDQALPRDGRPIPIELSVSEVEINDYRVFIVIARDITKRKKAEDQLQTLNEQLFNASRQAGMAEIASDVLHNVGNVLTHINVTATTIIEKNHASKIAGLVKAIALFDEHTNDLASFFTQDPKGQKLPTYLAKLADVLQTEQRQRESDLKELISSVDHVKEVVNAQQSIAKSGQLLQSTQLTDLLEDAVKINQHMLERCNVKIVRDYVDLPEIMVDRHRTVQILVNLIKNACDAMAANQLRLRTLTLQTKRSSEQSVSLVVNDTGCGIPKDTLERIFNNGFTTKENGHGFGLHSSANVAKQLGGSLTVASKGADQGATFTLQLPIHPTEKQTCQVA